MTDDELNKLARFSSLKYIICNYVLTLDNIKNVIVPHEMISDDDDVGPTFISSYQTHLSKEQIIFVFKLKY